MGALWKKYREMILYVFFGGCTTLVNLGAYGICYYWWGVPNVAATLVAWVLGVAFAFVTNKLWVFESKEWKGGVLLRELSAFVSCRAATGFLDLLVMFLCVDILHWNAMLMKVISNIMVIVLNYVASKLVIFTGKKK